ncbi:MAG: PH domain-containing protein, partial [Sarcina sp.]
KLSGFGKHKYCFGRAVVDKVGTARMFISNSSKVIYLHTSSISYGLSPERFDEFKDKIISKGFRDKEFKVKTYNWKEIIKQKNVYIAFIIVSIIIIMMILIPFILYLIGSLPGEMPLAFDVHFIPTVFGTGKQFAFKQMMYGVLNMIFLICMYYAAYFSAKYDKKIACRYIYLSLTSALLFLLVQIQILITYL